MVKHVAAVLLLVLAGLMAPAGFADASPHHQPIAASDASGETAATDADCPSHPAPQVDIDCCVMGCSSSALPLLAMPPQAWAERGRSDLPAPMLAVLSQHPEGLFRPPR
ncbi:MAG: hypothetical protein RIM84_05420 [Alphaproteobacteria bacterium]